MGRREARGETFTARRRSLLRALLLGIAGVAGASLTQGCGSGAEGVAGGSGQDDGLTRTLRRLEPHVSLATTDASGTKDMLGETGTGRSVAAVSAAARDAARRASASSFGGVPTGRSAGGPSTDALSEAAEDGVSVFSWCGTGEDRRAVAAAFDERAALAAGLSEEEVGTGRDMVRAVAAAMAAIAGGEPGVTAEGRALGMWITVGETAVFVASAMIHWFREMEDPLDNPSKSPAGNPRFRHSDETIRHLERSGFHLVPRYASWGGFGSNFARFLNNHEGRPVRMGRVGRAWGAYRTEAGLRMLADAPRSTFYVQRDEPNPEIFKYSQPSWWWPVYTFWWHMTR